MMRRKTPPVRGAGNCDDAPHDGVDLKVLRREHGSHSQTFQIGGIARWDDAADDERDRSHTEIIQMR